MSNWSNGICLILFLLHDFHRLLNSLLSVSSNLWEHLLEQLAQSGLRFFWVYRSGTDGNGFVEIDSLLFPPGLNGQTLLD